MDVIIEQISRSQRVLERHRFMGVNVSIGRAYDNDLIISDPHISEHHAILRDMGEDGWQIEDLNSKNGIYTNKHNRISSYATVVSGDEITIGRTHLRIYDRRHQVPDALSMNPVEKVMTPLSRTGNALFFIAFVLLIFALDSYLDQYVDNEFKHVLMDTVGITLVGICWALAWALIGRIMRHDARFLVQLVIVMGYLLSEVIFSNFLDLLAFNSSSGSTAFAVGVVGHFLLFSLLLWLNLYIAINQTDRKRLLLSCGVSGSAVTLVLLYYFLNVPGFRPYPDYVNYLKPPAVQWLHPVNTEKFLNDANVIFKKTKVDLEDSSTSD